MTIDHTNLRDRLNAKAKHEEENLRIEKMEIKYTPLFWIAVALVAFYVMVVPK